ncbi:biotin-dependent carboxyltransferase family protein [Chachezhania antarctica]|uniref:5-oxoprolinase subunit C family protein n=1 Tax=Chachezhania antarctica TaxID=2340860 RepID=UPI000EB2BF02|nr:urea amidolyase [Chachezhania antarctica]|tara:strand:- start:756 stop:1811 length:1056 start_codon:yes stop_codon:yes gene_type:complete
MTPALIVQSIGPAATIQDQGRPGYRDQGLSPSGAADLLALAEGAALLGQGADLAALEMPATGGKFQAEGDLRIALTGAPMMATLEDRPIAWNASHAVSAGQILQIGGAKAGVYGYLHLAGGIDAAPVLGARAAHLAAGLGKPVERGARLAAGAGAAGKSGLVLDVDDRFFGGEVRVVASLQTALFDDKTLARFEATAFKRGGRANRMGVEMLSEGDGFSASGQLDILSEVIVPGDIQMTGSGQPYVLLPESQTTGGYPRIGTVIPSDLPKVAQTPPGAEIRFRFVGMDTALEIESARRAHLKTLPGKVRPLVRDVHDIPDLLAYRLVGGAVSAPDDQTWGYDTGFNTGDAT